MSDKTDLRHMSKMSDISRCLTDCLQINGLHKSKSDMSDFVVRLLQSRKGKQYQCHEPLNKSNNDPPHTTYGTARRQAGRPIRCVRARGPPSALVSASSDHSGPNDRR